jgi:hypothetical protein
MEFCSLFGYQKIFCFYSNHSGGFFFFCGLMTLSVSKLYSIRPECFDICVTGTLWRKSWWPIGVQYECPYVNVENIIGPILGML